MKKEKLGNIITIAKGKVRFNAPMRNYTSFGIGGQADVLVDAIDAEDLKNIISFANENNIQVFVLGEGSNLLVTDKGIRGITLKLKGEFEKIEFSDNIVKAGAGCLWMSLIMECVDKGFGGLEFGSGIPGSVGGAVVMNAGTSFGEVFNVLEEIEVIDKNTTQRKIMKKNEIKFHYRSTDIVDKNLIVISAVFSLKKEAREICRRKVEDILNKRKQSQPLNLQSAGCIFKNPNGSYAGKIIEELNFKGKQNGDIQISPKHANFFVNFGSGTAKDVISLIEEVEKAALDKKGIKLEREIIIVGEE